jgi:hypothetical protein
LGSHQWKVAMNKKKRMNMVSKSIDVMNKKKLHHLIHNDSLKSTLKEKTAELLNSVYSIQVDFFNV